jgi:hypothetical protein
VINERLTGEPKVTPCWAKNRQTEVCQHPIQTRQQPAIQSGSVRLERFTWRGPEPFRECDRSQDTCRFNENCQDQVRHLTRFALVVLAAIAITSALLLWIMHPNLN